MAGNQKKVDAQVFARYGSTLAAAGVFSLFLNLLILTLPLYTLQLFDRVLLSRSLETLIMLTIVAAGALLVLAALELIRARILLRIGVRLERELGTQALASGIATASRGRAHAGPWLREVAELRNFLTGPAIGALFDAPWVPVFIAVIFLIHTTLGVVAFVGALALFGLALANELATRQPLGTAASATAAALARAEGFVRGSEAIEAMGMLPAVVATWDRDAMGYLAPLLQAGNRASLIASSAKFLRLVLQILIMGTGALLATRGEITAGAMMAASILFGRALAPVEASIAGWRAFVTARAAYGRLRTMLAEAQLRRRIMRLPTAQGRLSLEQVVFTPPGAERSTLRGITFELRSGEMLGVIGSSAAGKSTLARLIVGAWAATRGTVRLDGADVSAWAPEDLGRNVGYLPQDVHLFAGTVRANIARMAENAPLEAVLAAAQMAEVHEMILRLPKGYETELGESGINLSGGQRQRIALARALFGQPRLLVLDEPNAHLDGPAEMALARAIAATKARGATVLIITHRPSLVSQADKILLLRDGAIEMFGRRHEVLERITRQALQSPSAGSDPVAVAERAPWPRLVEATANESAAHPHDA